MKTKIAFLVALFLFTVSSFAFPPMEYKEEHAAEGVSAEQQERRESEFGDGGNENEAAPAARGAALDEAAAQAELFLNRLRALVAENPHAARFVINEEGPVVALEQGSVTPAEREKNLRFTKAVRDAVARAYPEVNIEDLFVNYATSTLSGRSFLTAEKLTIMSNLEVIDKRNVSM